MTARDGSRGTLDIGGQRLAVSADGELRCASGVYGLSEPRSRHARAEGTDSSPYRLPVLQQTRDDVCCDAHIPASRQLAESTMEPDARSGRPSARRPQLRRPQQQAPVRAGSPTATSWLLRRQWTTTTGGIGSPAASIATPPRFQPQPLKTERCRTAHPARDTLWPSRSTRRSGHRFVRNLNGNDAAIEFAHNHFSSFER